MKRQLPSQLLEEQFLGLASRQAPLSESIRMGAQLMLQKAVELELTEFLGRDHYQRHGEGLLQGYRNGYEDQQVQTAEGPLHLKMPQVRDKVKAFDSVWLRTLVRRSDNLTALIPQSDVRGMSTRDLEAALGETMEVEGVSKSAVSTLCNPLKHDFERWQNRDLPDQDLLYMCCDGLYLRLRREDAQAVAVLCAYGIKTDGRNVLLHLAVGDQESTACWKSFFEDMNERSGLSLMFAVLADASAGWVGLRSRPPSVATWTLSKPTPRRSRESDWRPGCFGGGLRLGPGGRAEDRLKFFLAQVRLWGYKATVIASTSR